MNQIPLTSGGFPQPNPNMTVGGYPNPNISQQPIYYPQPYQPQPVYISQPHVMPLLQVDPVRLQKLKDTKVPGISFKNLIASVGLQPLSRTTAPVDPVYGIPPTISQPPLYGQPIMPYPTSNPIVNLQAIHIHQLMQTQVNDKCQGCEMQLRNDVCFGCVQCKFYLCQSCYNVVYQGYPNYGLHTAHQLTPKVFIGWRCNGCTKRVQVSKKLSMRCGICDKDYCLECFFKRK